MAPHQEIALYLFPIPLALHFALFIASTGSPRLRCLLGHTAVQDSDAADTVFVRAARNAGKDRIVQVCRGTAKGSVSVFGYSYDIPRRWFEFQKKVYDFVDGTETSPFAKRPYPTRGGVAAILSCSGHDEDSYEAALSLWGSNEFDIPLPTFLELYQEHMVAPFFLFQVVCLCLWSLDEYWYYSAMTLVMLMTFEGMLCKQRQNSLQMLREMRRPAIPVYRLRRLSAASKGAAKGKAGSSFSWDVVSSEALVPGDVISVTATIASRQAGAGLETQQMSVTMPCDAVIVGGSCVVNEAMLTGESTPQVKESLLHALAEIPSTPEATGPEVDLDSSSDMACRRYQLYGGTTLLQHSPPDKASSVPYPPAPNRGCIAVVVRTGFGTTQVDAYCA